LAQFARRLARRLPDVPDRHSGDERSQRVVGREHAVVPVAVFSRRWHKIGEPVEEVGWRKVDDALPVWRGRLLDAAWTDPLTAFVTRERVADSVGLSVTAVDHRKPVDCEGGPGAGAHEVLQTG
jgi:hypothetical protein